MKIGTYERRRVLLVTTAADDQASLARRLRDRGQEVIVVGWLSADHSARTAIAEDVDVAVVPADELARVAAALAAQDAADIAVVPGDSDPPAIEAAAAR